MERVGDLLPEMARHLGLDAELRLVRARQTWDAIISERVPPAAGACHLVALQPGVIVVDVDAPIVAQELRLRSTELLAAFAAAPGGLRADEIRIRVRTAPADHSEPDRGLRG
jgi:predicted nucleic acid-binding Zn ribbon protein